MSVLLYLFMTVEWTKHGRAVISL